MKEEFEIKNLVLKILKIYIIYFIKCSKFDFI